MNTCAKCNSNIKQTISLKRYVSDSKDYVAILIEYSCDCTTLSTGIVNSELR